ncbi:hypothetical protein BOTCAL_0194g00160 [Botryotinia calthae]|uniref:Uncharacterized protein n=1 Tax=Botryotinia calthae TaxID=38488 RepID=A0A4Y8D0B5_9HELO|nr:hypothetical protein BOTCAL_0194g00160 [Botryotinia calthae]
MILMLVGIDEGVQSIPKRVFLFAFALVSLLLQSNNKVEQGLTLRIKAELVPHNYLDTLGTQPEIQKARQKKLLPFFLSSVMSLSNMGPTADTITLVTIATNATQDLLRQTQGRGTVRVKCIF